MKQKIIWALIGGLVVIAGVGLFLAGQWYGIKTTAYQQVAQNKNTANQDWIKSKRQENTNKNKVVGNEAGWKTFTNVGQGYRISYPANKDVAQLGTSGREEDRDLTDGACISLRLDSGSIAVLGKISTPDIATMCLRTGLGTEWSPAPSLKVELFGKTYTANGMKKESASAGYREEFYHVNTTTGEKVDFSIEVNEKYAPEKSYTEAKNQVLEVLKTLEHI